MFRYKACRDIPARLRLYLGWAWSWVFAFISIYPSSIRPPAQGTDHDLDQLLGPVILSHPLNGARSKKIAQIPREGGGGTLIR
jgi:hypothetical protein